MLWLLFLQVYFETYLRLSQDEGFLLTEGLCSYAVVLLQDGCVQLFESHGHLRSWGEVFLNMIGTLVLENLKHWWENVNNLSIECANVRCETLEVLNNLAIVIEPLTAVEPNGVRR